MSSLKKMWVAVCFGFMVALTLIQVAPSSAADTQNAVEIMEKSQQAFFYPGSDMKVKVKMELVTGDGKTRGRLLTMLRKNEAGSKNQKFFLYFHEPGDVRRIAFLVWKYSEKDDDRWIFIPAINMARRIAASDSRSSFVGSDFTYEEISGRDISADTHTLLREEKLGDADCYVVQSAPKASTDYTKKISWINKNNYLPLKEEYYDVQNELSRVFTAEMITDITVGEGAAKKTYPTPMKRTMRNIKSEHRTEVTFSGMAYDMGLEDAIFTERSLQNPPQQGIK